MEEPEQDIVTNLPRPEPVDQQHVEPGPGVPIFDVRNVSIWYSAFKAVTDVSLSIYEHEITAFIGSSGSGKTTVLRAFNRMNDLVPGARLEGEMDYRGVAVRRGFLSDRRAAPHRHGVPEAEPIPQVDL
jgi:ABC-type glutathione transport system ATPase component